MIERDIIEESINYPLPEIHVSTNMEAMLDAVKIPDIFGDEGINVNTGEYFMQKVVIPAEQSFYNLRASLMAVYTRTNGFHPDEDRNIIALHLAHDCWDICVEAIESDKKGTPYGRIIAFMLTKLSSIVSDCGLLPYVNISYGAEDIEKQMAMVWIHLMEKNLFCETVAKRVRAIDRIGEEWASKHTIYVVNDSNIPDGIFRDTAYYLFNILHGMSPLNAGGVAPMLLDHANVTDMFLTEKEKYERSKNGDARLHPIS